MNVWRQNARGRMHAASKTDNERRAAYQHLKRYGWDVNVAYEQARKNADRSTNDYERRRWNAIADIIKVGGLWDVM